ncbi:hypothetical protein AcV5_000365 [Taiwanofungus camphoratus]|nr:hypothetical protein AcV7_003557 [Antrodia cinnamomea]KAI0938756.1 hypothetical protein AcV5_000365 [Antrodia cinnamomea]
MPEVCLYGGGWTVYGMTMSTSMNDGNIIPEEAAVRLATIIFHFTSFAAINARLWPAIDAGGTGCNLVMAMYVQDDMANGK